MWHLLDLLQALASASSCDPSLALWLVEELLDAQTIAGCRVVFDYLEARRERLVGGAGAGKARQLIVLRCCNELLRRLSRAEDAVFCGRVCMFLFQGFPLGDKSSVNLRGEFHVENRTVWDDVSAGRTGDSMEVDAPEEDVAGAGEGEGDANRKKEDASVGADLPTVEIEASAVDIKTPAADVKPPATEKEALENTPSMDELYIAFWSLQDVFSNPPKTFEPATLLAFKMGLEMTLAKFKSIPKVLQTQGPLPATATGRTNRKRKHNADAAMSDTSTNAQPSTFNPKYLTSRDLFELELHDLTFQRHILVQSLILLDFLLSLTPAAKARLASVKAQRAMLYSFTLPAADAAWATATRAAVAALLQDASDGKFYYRMVDSVLARDRNWLRWKIESCPPIARPPISPDEFVSARDGARRACASRRMKPPMGAVDLSFVHDTQNVNNLAKLKATARNGTPTLEGLLRDITTTELDLEMADGDERRMLKEVRAARAWMLLRVAAKSKFALFDKIDEGKNLSLLSEDPEKALPGAHTEGTNEADADVADSATKIEEDSSPMPDAPDTDVVSDRRAVPQATAVA